MAKQTKAAADASERLVCVNKKARFQFEVLDTFEAGLSLRGTEVKVLRQGKISLDESYASIVGDEAFLIGANIPEYSHGNLLNHEPKRQRKLLLKAREIHKLKEKTQQKGLTIIPLKVYFSLRGFAKVTVAICRGKKLHDKRATERERQARRELRDA